MTHIAHLMESMNLTISELCRQAKLHSTDAYQLRKGSRSAGPSVRRRVADALKVPEEQLFDESGWPIQTAVVAG